MHEGIIDKDKTYYVIVNKVANLLIYKNIDYF